MLLFNQSFLFHFFQELLWYRPAGAMLLMRQMPLYTLFKARIFRHAVFFVPGFVEWHNRYFATAKINNRMLN